MLSVMDVLQTQGVEFSALAPSDGALPRELDRRGIDRRSLDLLDQTGQRRPRNALVQQVVEFASTCSADLLHANSLSMSRILGAAAADISVPCCGHLRDILKLSRAAVQDLNQNMCLVAVSQATRSFHAEQGVDPARLRVIYNGVDCRVFQPRSGTGVLRAELKLGSQHILVVHIGQISLRKAQDVYVESAVRCAESCPQMHFLLVGERHSRKSESIEFEQAWMRRIEVAGLQQRFHMLGRRSDISQLLNDCDILVHTSRQEPLGRVLLEAGASGLPVVATNVGGTREIFPVDSMASMIAPDDPAALEAELVRLADNPGLRQRLGLAARRQVAEAFDVQSAANALRSCWNSVIARQSAGGDSDSSSTDLL